MSSAVNNLGTFNPNQYKNNGTGNKSTQRMAGDYLTEFANKNANDKKDSTNTYSYEGSNGNNYGTNTEKMLFGNDSNSSSTNNSSMKTGPDAATSTPSSAPAPAAQSQSKWTDGSGRAYKAKEESPEAAAARAAQQQKAKDNLANRASELTASYDPGKYQYYESEFGSGTGADAYGKDMANYESYVAMNNGDSLLAGHLGLVSQMMHPDWGRSQKTGGGNPVVEQNYSQKPTGAAYGPGGKKEGSFGGGWGTAGQPKRKY